MKPLTTLFLMLFYTHLVSQSSISPDFSANSTVGCMPLTVNFTNLSTGGTSYKWDFGNGSYSTLENPSIVFLNPGVYSVKLVAKNSTNADSTIKINYITVHPKPSASFTQTITGHCSNSNSVQFTSTTQNASSFYWDLDDGTTSTLSSQQHTYLTAGNFTPKLIATNSFGCSDLAIGSTSIVIHNFPDYNVFSDVTSVCGLNSAIHFSHNANGGNLQYHWDFGDGSTSYSSFPSHIYTTSGAFAVSLTITNNNGCSNTIHLNDSIHVNIPQNISLSLNSDSICLNESIQVSANTTSGVSWNFGDGTSSTQNPDSHSYTSPGSFVLSFTSSDSNNCPVNKIVDTITVLTIPQATITSSTSMGCSPLLVNYTASGTNIDSYNWSFSNGTTSNSDSTSNQYTEADNSSILTVTSSSGCSISYSVPPVILLHENASITSSDSSGCSPLTVDFFLSGNISNPQWFFGDGGVASGQQTTHIFDSIGIFNVGVSYINSFGCIDTSWMQYSIETINPEVNSFNIDSVFVCPNTDVTFNAVNIGNGQNIWEFPDGTTNAGQSPSFTFVQPGTNVVSLTSYNNAGCMFTLDTFALVFVDSSIIDLGVYYNCPLFEVDFSPQNNNNYSYNFLNGDSDTNSTTSYEFAHLPAIVQVTMTSPGGCSYTNFMVVDTICDPSPSGSGSSLLSGSGNMGYDQTLSPGQSFCLSDLLTLQTPFTDSSYISWEWQMGDGTTLTSQNISYLYADTGTYTIVHYAFLGNGVYDSIVIRDYHIVGNPVSQILYQTDYGCNTIDLHLENAGQNYSNTIWDINGGFSTQTNVDTSLAINYSSYPIFLTVSDSLGCHDESVLVQEAYPPSVSFYYQDHICYGDSAVFNVFANNYIYIDWYIDSLDSVRTYNGVLDYLFTSSGVFDISISVLDSTGCIRNYSLPTSVSVFNPNSDFTPLDSVLGCRNSPITLSAANPNASSYLWTVNNNPFYNSIIHPTLPNNGVYDVTLTVSDNGCTSTTEKVGYIHINSPTAILDETTTIYCDSVKKQYINQSIGVTSFFWVTAANDTLLTNTYSETYSSFSEGVSLIVENDFGCMDLASSDSVFVFKGNPLLSDTTICQGGVFSILDTLSNFDQFFAIINSDTVYGQNNSISYVPGDTGVFNLSVVYELDNGCSVEENLPPISVINNNNHFSFSYSDSCSPVLVNFNYQANNYLDKVTWDFGDGATSSVLSPSHIYSNPGIYYPKLIVRNIAFCIDTLTTETPIVVLGLDAGFTFNNSALCDSGEVFFTNNSNQAVSYEWHFGDGSTANTPNPIHNYSDSGTYSVSVFLTDTNGCTTFQYLPDAITIFNSPIVNFVSVDSIVCVNTPANIQVSVSPITTYTLFYGDGSTTTSSNTATSYSYSSQGNYELILTGTSPDGCVATDTANIEVEPFISANIISNDSVICSGDPIFQLFSENVGGVWSGAGITDSSSGIYNSTGIVGENTIYYNYSGVCSNSDSIVITSVERPNTSFTTNSGVCNNDSSFVLTAATSGGEWIVDNMVLSSNIFKPQDYTSGIHQIIYQINSVCPNSDTGSIEIWRAPVVDLSIENTNFCAPFSLDIINQSIYPSNSISQWTLNDSSVSEQNLLNQQLYSGHYEINLLITTSEGCQNSLETPLEFNVINSDSLPVPEIIRATVFNNESVYVEWDTLLINNPLYYQTHLWRATDSLGFEYVSTFSDETFYLDENVSVNTTNYSYYITPENTCGVISAPSEIHRSILLEIQSSQYTDKLKWTPYKGWNNQIEKYLIQKQDENGNWITIKEVDPQTLEVIIDK